MSLRRIGLLCWILLSGCFPSCADAEPGTTISVGLAKVDITPTGPIQLINVKEPVETTRVVQKLFARAMAIGSGGPYALAAARALKSHSSLNAGEIVRTALDIAGDICIYTNRNIVVLELEEKK